MLFAVLFICGDKWWRESIDSNSEWLDGMRYTLFSDTLYVAEFIDSENYSQLGSQILNKYVIGTLMFFKVNHGLMDILSDDIDYILGDSREIDALIREFSDVVIEDSSDDMIENYLDDMNENGYDSF